MSRRYLMSPPEYFSVEYAINPWMDTSATVDTGLALKQWQLLREALVRLGHDVRVLPARPGLPDMVYAANGAFSVDGTVYGARFAHPQRAEEAEEHRAFYESAGWRYVPPVHTNEGEGDFAYCGGFVLAGHGFRTEPPAHAEAQEVLGRPVVSLRLVDPYFYHLDMALAVLDEWTIAYYPEAFSDGSREVLRRLFPYALVATREDALAFGLNLISDGRHAVLDSEATGMAARLREAGYQPVPVEMSELRKGGGSVRCCVAEIRTEAGSAGR
jgi:N-dimethylarginine dimethylaminohydrolase